MDSMRSLNTSLPRSPRVRRPHGRGRGGTPGSRAAPQAATPPELLIQAFKSAALSVTNLYKTAAADQISARSNGYQEALNDLLTFLDDENIGLDDGEGWRVRQWITEHYDDDFVGQTSDISVRPQDAGAAAARVDSDDDRRSSSASKHSRQASVASTTQDQGTTNANQPTGDQGLDSRLEMNQGHQQYPRQHRSPSLSDVLSPTTATHQIRMSMSPTCERRILHPQSELDGQQQCQRSTQVLPSAPFTFRAPFIRAVDQTTSNQYPTSSSTDDLSHQTPHHHLPPPAPRLRVEVVPRGLKSLRSGRVGPKGNPARYSQYHHHNHALLQAQLHTGNHSSASKRRTPFSEFFDIGSLGDGGGPQKKPRAS